MTDEEAKRIAFERRIDLWCRSTGFNRFCYKCPLIGLTCRGSTSVKWHDCSRRNAYERKYGYGNTDL